MPQLQGSQQLHAVFAFDRAFFLWASIYVNMCGPPAVIQVKTTKCSVRSYLAYNIALLMSKGDDHYKCEGGKAR